MCGQFRYMPQPWSVKGIFNATRKIYATCTRYATGDGLMGLEAAVDEALVVQIPRRAPWVSTKTGV